MSQSRYALLDLRLATGFLLCLSPAETLSRPLDADQKITADTVYDGASLGKDLTLEAILEVFVSTIEEEDYVMGEHQQRTAESGLLEHSIFGRNEAPLHHFHNSFRSALGMRPLERVN